MSSSPRVRRIKHQTDHDYAIKAILLGDIGVGKTTFFHTFLHGQCPSPGDDAVSMARREASGGKIVAYDGKRVRLTLWDTAGQERYRSLTASYYRGAHACIIMYDVNKEESFNNVTSWLESVLDYGDTISGSHTILVANSTGHNHHFSTDDHSIGPVVDRQRAEQLASNYLIPFFEVDFQQDAQSVDFVVNMLVTMVMTRALDNRLLTQTIRPYNSKVEQLVAKESGRCVGCCSM